MAIKRKDIRDILDNESLDAEARAKSILDLFHRETDELRDQIDSAKAELEKSKADLTTATSEKDSAVKALDDYKNEQTLKETKALKEAAYRKLLTDTGVSEKRINTVLKATDLTGVELNKDGTIKDATKHAEAIKADWADFINATQTGGANVQTPPDNSGGSITKEQFAKMSYKERLRVYNETPELYQTLKET